MSSVTFTHKKLNKHHGTHCAVRNASIPNAQRPPACRFCCSFCLSKDTNKNSFQKSRCVQKHMNAATFGLVFLRQARCVLAPRAPRPPREEQFLPFLRRSREDKHARRPWPLAALLAGALLSGFGEKKGRKVVLEPPDLRTNYACNRHLSLQLVASGLDPLPTYLRMCSG